MSMGRLAKADDPAGVSAQFGRDYADPANLVLSITTCRVAAEPVQAEHAAR
jgi:hypothetical protein